MCHISWSPLIINVLFYWSSYTSGFFQLPKFELPKLPPPCDVSLPQHNINLKRICQDLRKIDPAKNKLIYKLKRQDELNGFALISTNPVELRIIALADPFISHYTHNYLLQAVEAIGSVAKYGLAHHLGKEPINHISEYLSLSNWFQNAMENKGLVNICLFPLYWNYQQLFPISEKLVSLRTVLWLMQLECGIFACTLQKGVRIKAVPEFFLKNILIGDFVRLTKPRTFTNWEIFNALSFLWHLPDDVRWWR